MVTREPKIIFEGISIDDFFVKLQQHAKPESTSDPAEEILNVDQASAFLKLSTPTIHRLKAANKIPFTKIGARVVYRRSQLIAWLDEKTNGTPKVHAR